MGLFGFGGRSPEGMANPASQPEAEKQVVQPDRVEEGVHIRHVEEDDTYVLERDGQELPYAIRAFVTDLDDRSNYLNEEDLWPYNQEVSGEAAQVATVELVESDPVKHNGIYWARLAENPVATEEQG